MQLDEFAEVVRSYWATYFSRVEQGITPAGQVAALYPSELVIYNFAAGFAFELIGSRSDFRGLRVSKSRIDALELALSQFHYPDGNGDSAAVTFPEGTGSSGLSGMVVTANDQIDDLLERYPGFSGILASEEVTMIRRMRATEGPLIRIGKCDDITFRDVMVVNGLGGCTRIRYIHLMMICSASQEAREMRKRMKRQFPLDLSGATAVRERPSAADDKRLIAVQLASRVTTPGHIEVDLSAFLRAHEGVLKGAFGYSDILYEPFLPWQQGTRRFGEPDCNPDFMGKRRDGLWDLVELKLPLLDRAGVTRGAGATTRFTQDAYLALSQLSHYEDYFSERPNAEYARKRYGIEVNAPRKIMILGTAENVDAVEVGRALITARPNTELIDYDSLIGLYLR